MLNGIRASLPIALILLMGLDLYYIFRVESQLRSKNFIFLEAVLQNTAEARKRVAVQKCLKMLQQSPLLFMTLHFIHSGMSDTVFSKFQTCLL